MNLETYICIKENYICCFYISNYICAFQIYIRNDARIIFKTIIFEIKKLYLRNYILKIIFRVFRIIFQQS